MPVEKLAGHYHDTYGQAVANIYASLEAGVAVFDAAVAGLSGCPYAAGASGNVATEDVVYLLDGLGIHTGIDLDALVDTAGWISERLGRPPASKVARAVLAKGQNPYKLQGPEDPPTMSGGRRPQAHHDHPISLHSVCRMNPATGYCEGCFRTIPEITDWGRADDDRKRDPRRSGQSPLPPTSSRAACAASAWFNR